MTAISIKALVADATKANLNAYQSKFGPKSLDATVSPDSETTLRDLISELAYEDDPDEAALLAAERRDDDNRYRLASLLPSELDWLLAHDRWGTIAGEAALVRERAERGEGWPSTLDRRP